MKFPECDSAFAPSGERIVNSLRKFKLTIFTVRSLTGRFGSGRSAFIGKLSTRMAATSCNNSLSAAFNASSAGPAPAH